MAFTKFADLRLSEEIFPYARCLSDLQNLQLDYQSASPFPHIVLDQFLNQDVLEKAVSEFPSVDSGKWVHYAHVNEKKYGKTDSSQFGPTLKRIVDELNSPQFVSFLSELTGIQGLFADPSLEGGGLHQSKRGGYLNIHADFTVHPHHRTWRRRVNVLVYLNHNWQEAYGGHLELWDKKMKACEKKVLPVFNRSVIFNTDFDSFHGHPEPLTCPESFTRKSLAFYYFTEEKEKPLIRSTEYRARPKDGIKGVWVYLDKMVLRIYDRIKRTLKLNDDFASSVLSKLSRLFHRTKD